MKLIPTTINPVSITLYRGIPFDNNYSEHTLLSNQFKFHGVTGGADSPVDIGQNKENFINMKNSDNEYIYPRVTKTGTYNFAFGNGLVTSVVMELTGDEINSNYIKVVSGNDVYYYFITGIIQKNEVTYLLNLELDVLMTYSEEFLTNIKDKPILVERKHCRRILGEVITYQHQLRVGKKVNMACFNQETTFAGFKSNITKNVQSLSLTEYDSALDGINWFYIIVGKSSDDNRPMYDENNNHYPYSLVCFPNIDFNLIFGDNQRQMKIENILKVWCGNPNVHKIILSPFPPFKESDNLSFSISNNELTIQITNYNTTSFAIEFYTGLNDTGTYMRAVGAFSGLFGGFYLKNGYGGKYKYEEITNYFSLTHPTINDERDTGEYKLQIEPFKTLKMSSYYGGENVVPTQLLFTKYLSISSNNKIIPYTIASSNAETNSYLDYCDLGNYEVDSKRGQANAVAYNYPTSTSAEEVYNLTQKSEYENTRLMNALTGALQIGGGVAGIAFGGVMGKVGGAISIASGVLGEVKNISEWSSKIKDLKSTPNSYNFAGSSFSLDTSISKGGIGNGKLYPYLITYGVDDISQNIAGEFLYHYGYDYNAESYFSTDLWTGTDNVFERQLFNYVKIREDISSKLVGNNLPLVVAKKINEILNAGIKLWSFFTMSLTDTSVVTSVLNDYFQKSKYCNAEVIIEKE